MFLKLTKHARTRITQRVKAKYSINLIKKIFKKENFIPIGYDLNKKHVKHCLFYFYNLNEFFVACIDENTNEMLTILFGYEFKNWNISSETFDNAKLKSIDSMLQSNINLSFSYIDLNLMKKNPEEFYFIKKYFDRHGLEQEEKKKRTRKKKKNKKQQTVNPEVSLENLRLKQKKLREENINSSQQYQINKKDEFFIEEYKERVKQKEEENRIKFEKYQSDFQNNFNDVNIKLIEMLPTHFLCKFNLDCFEDNPNVVNLFKFFNPDLTFKAYRVKKIKNNIQYIFKKEETELLAKQYIILKYSKGYEKTVKEYLVDCGFGFFNNNIYINALNVHINKKVKINNFDKKLELLNEKFLNQVNKSLV